ncbi:ABC transporter ATP-binding protein [candidate division WOR-3 bacterium]|nr:ABC transporter ATP-binding protein [candidate division WOR-3 bacterium]
MNEYSFREEEFTKVFRPELWKKVLGFSKPYSKLVFFLFVVMIFVALIDAVFPLMTKYAIDRLIIARDFTFVVKFVLLYTILVLFQSVNVFLLIALAGRIDMWMCYDIRKSAFDKLQSLSFSYFDKTPVGWLMARMTSDVERIADTFAWGFVDLIWGLTMMTAISFIMFYLNWKIALSVLVTVPVLVYISFKFQKLILKSYRSVRKINSQITGSYNEGITGAKTTKTLVRETENLAEFKGLTGKMFKASFTAALRSSMYLPVVLFISSAGTAIAVIYGGTSVTAGFITYGTLVAFISYSIRFFEPVQELARIFAEFQNAQASAERVFSLLGVEPEIKDSPQVLATQTDSMNLSSSNKIKGEVEFINVFFRYGTGYSILENFNFKVNEGESVALVGETGSGKTTIASLVCRFYEPVSGKILIDGKDYKEMSLHTLQSNIGVMLQTPHLFSGTISDNIRYGKLEAAENEIREAAHAVFADRFINKLDNGYRTEVGEGGGFLSVGQKQLISLARALLSDPKILILDEATSSVDTETEKLIQTGIKKLMHGRTSIIIAHRLSTITSVDRIVLIENGKILEQGTHGNLIKSRGRYYKLYKNQFIHEKELEYLGV